MTTKPARAAPGGDRQQLNSENRPTQTLSQPSSELGRTLQVLCSLKSQAQFTPHQLATWAAVLGLFPTETVNRAVLQLGLSTDPFPDLGKLVTVCQHVEAEKNPQVVRGETSTGRPVKGLVMAAAKALGLQI